MRGTSTLWRVHLCQVRDQLFLHTAIGVRARQCELKCVDGLGLEPSHQHRKRQPPN